MCLGQLITVYIKSQSMLLCSSFMNLALASSQVFIGHCITFLIAVTKYLSKAMG